MQTLLGYHQVRRSRVGYRTTFIHHRHQFLNEIGQRRLHEPARFMKSFGRSVKAGAEYGVWSFAI